MSPRVGGSLPKLNVCMCVYGEEGGEEKERNSMVVRYSGRLVVIGWIEGKNKKEKGADQPKGRKEGFDSNHLADCALTHSLTPSLTRSLTGERTFDGRDPRWKVFYGIIRL